MSMMQLVADYEKNSIIEQVLLHEIARPGAKSIICLIDLLCVKINRLRKYVQFLRLHARLTAHHLMNVSIQDRI